MNFNYIHKPGCPGPMLCNCYPTGGEGKPKCLPCIRTDKQRDHLYQLSIVLKWLGERDNQCDACINACLQELTDPKNEPLDHGHYRWMCRPCREIIDQEMAEGDKKLRDMLVNAVNAHKNAKQKIDEQKDAAYHIGRLCFILGEDGEDWLEVVNVLRKGLGLKFKNRPNYDRPIRTKNTHAMELLCHLRRIKDHHE
jgi:hypothetical protein